MPKPAESAGQEGAGATFAAVHSRSLVGVTSALSTGNSLAPSGIRASEHLAPKEALVSLVTALELAGLALSTTGRVLRLLQS